MRGIPHKEQAPIVDVATLGAVRASHLRRLYERTSMPGPPQKAARLCWGRAARGIGASPILLWDSKIFVVGFEDRTVGLRPNPRRCPRITDTRLRARNQQMPDEKRLCWSGFDLSAVGRSSRIAFHL